tara:strand:- start:282 stop:464 length:183 start_codon:yes stop_codon:yes gene_type:complete
MAVKPEEVRQAKKFLENKKISIKQVKPHLFAIASNSLRKNFNETLDFFKKGNSGTTDSSD